MRVWQVPGGSGPGKQAGWKLLPIDESFSAHLLPEKSHAPREGYRRGDSAMGGGIRCQL
jgi:hypothetical protein